MVKSPKWSNPPTEFVQIHRICLPARLPALVRVVGTITGRTKVAWDVCEALFLKLVLFSAKSFRSNLQPEEYLTNLFEPGCLHVKPEPDQTWYLSKQPKPDLKVRMQSPT